MFWNLLENFRVDGGKKYKKMKKYCVIIDTYPSSEQEQSWLIHNLKILKNQGIDVLVTSHHPCTQEIIENSDFFIFEKKNNYHYLDSEIINENLEGVQNPVYCEYFQLGNDTFYDKVVITGWSVAITSQLINSIKFLYGKGYNYAFYMISDCIFPDNIKEKLDLILENSKEFRNYFIENLPPFNSWYAGFLFGFSIDENLFCRLPEGDVSENTSYQKFFPNCSAEDVIMKIWGNDSNFVENYSKIDDFFGVGNWNLVSSVIKKGESSLHAHSSSSIYVSDSLKDFMLVLNVLPENPCESVFFRINLSDFSGNVLLSKEITLPRFHWYKEDVSHLFHGRGGLILEKYLQDSSDETCSFRDSIRIDRSSIHQYAQLKKFRRSS